jgi:hypothetical protein
MAALLPTGVLAQSMSPQQSGAALGADTRWSGQP